MIFFGSIISIRISFYWWSRIWFWFNTSLALLNFWFNFFIFRQQISSFLIFWAFNYSLRTFTRWSFILWIICSIIYRLTYIFNFSVWRLTIMFFRSSSHFPFVFSSIWRHFLKLFTTGWIWVSILLIVSCWCLLSRTLIWISWRTGILISLIRIIISRRVSLVLIIWSWRRLRHLITLRLIWIRRSLLFLRRCNFFWSTKFPLSFPFSFNLYLCKWILIFIQF